MLIDSIPQITYEQVANIEYQGDHLQYDTALAKLVTEHDFAIVKNPNLANPNLVYFIDSIPDNQRQCIVYYYKDEWLAKIFYRGWTADQGYKSINIRSPQVVWRKNPDLDNSMTFIDTPFGQWEPEPWDVEYTMTWYMDPQFNPTSDRVWVMICEVIGASIKGSKDMGYLSPEVNIEYNPMIPALPIDLDGALPAYWDLSYTCAYYLDPSHCDADNEKVWLVKIEPSYRKTKDWKWLGMITPSPDVIYNPTLGIVNYDIDISQTHFSDFAYENQYLLDRKHLDNDHDDIWAFKVLWYRETQGLKVMGYASPLVNTEVNRDLGVDLDLDYIIHEKEFNRTLVWYTDPKLVNMNKIWAVKKYVGSAGPELDQGLVDLDIEQEFDVVFIDYDEPNAETNWQRLQAIAPNALRVSGIKGILEAHKAAARKSTTEMFWVVDADCYLQDDWSFDYIPSVFDRDCVFVWHSLNPVTDLQYGHGGIKLLPRQKLIELTDWGTDLTQSISQKIKVINRISNVTLFNTSEFATWRSAFREVAKLSQMNSAIAHERIQRWLSPRSDARFAQWAEKGARDALKWVKSNPIDLINNYDYLAKHFKKNYE